jgi:PAS domain S-box-containing protein
MTNQASTRAFLAGGGELGELTRQKDWSQTPLGSPEQWPQSLRTVLSLLLHAQTPMFLWWGPDLIQFYNDAYRPSLGLSGKHPTALGQRGEDCWPEIWPVIKPLIDQVLAGKTTGAENQLIPIQRNNQLEEVYWTFSYNPVWNETNQVAGILVICQETTKTVIRARDDQERFRFATEAAQFGTWEVDAGTNVVRWDSRCAELFGLASSQDIPYEMAIRHIHPDDVALVDETVRWGMNPQSGGQYDLTYRTIGAEDGRLRWVRFTGRGYFDQAGNLYRFGGVAHEVTKEVVARQAIAASEANLRSLFEQAPVAIAILRGPELTYELANTQYVDLVNRTAHNDLIGKPLLEALPELRNQGIDTVLHTVIQTGTAYTVPERRVDRLRDGRAETSYYNFVYEPLRNAEGIPEGVFIMATDVTGQKLARQQDERLLLRERELNDLKSNFVTLASHEFRTPMGTILSSASLISRYNSPADVDKRGRHVLRIKSAVNNLTGLLNDFLSLSQMEQTTLYGQPHWLNIQTFCQEVIADMERVIKPNQRVVYTHESGDPLVSVDGQMLKNILINLLVNASKYSADGKEIELTTAVAGDQLRLTVRDEGIGIPDADKDKLFINFFRARNVSHELGTGLGLYIVKRYVDLLGGSITFTSELNSGTIFTIQLPLRPLPHEKHSGH